MSVSTGPLAGLRIGCVKYLNSRPLIHTCPEPIHLAHPSELARELHAGRLDAALVPVFEILQHPHYALVDGVAISSDGPVYSVFLAHREPLVAIREVSLDPASLTSANLIRVLLREFHGLSPEFVPEAPDSNARLLIGNQAIEFLLSSEGSAGWQILDLGAEWKRCTGLPFVYAAWALRPGLGNVAAVAEAFRALKAEGLERIEEIVSAEQIGTIELRRRYLTEHIRFDLGTREKAGLCEYRRLLRAQGRISASSTSDELVFV